MLERPTGSTVPNNCLVRHEITEYKTQDLTEPEFCSTQLLVWAIIVVRQHGSTARSFKGWPRLGFHWRITVRIELVLDPDYSFKLIVLHPTWSLVLTTETGDNRLIRAASYLVLVHTSGSDGRHGSHVGHW